MQLRRHLGLFYGILVALILIMGVWWVVFMSLEGGALQRWQIEHLETDRSLAEDIAATLSLSQAGVDSLLARDFGDLRVRREGDSFVIEVDPAVREAIAHEGDRRRRMLVSEGAFFLLLLAGAGTILLLAHRSEREFCRSRELFLTGATHEFKTPLAAIRLYTETLGREDLTDADRQRIRVGMLEDADRLDSLVDRILAVANPTESGFGPRIVLDLKDECEKVLGELGGFLGAAGAEVTTRLPADCRIHGQRAAFHLALHDLLRNAARHGGAPARIELRLEAGERRHRLTVRDHGPGIARELHGRIFDCFYSGAGEARGKGAGLGLFLVARSVEKLGGRIDLESEIGHGAAFTLVLPASTEERS